MVISSLGSSSFNPTQRTEHKGHHKPATPSDLFSRLSSLTGGDGSGNIKKAVFANFLSKLDASSPHAKPLQDLKAKFDKIAGDDGEISKAEFSTALESGILQPPPPPQGQFRMPSGSNANWNFMDPKSLTKEQLTPPLDFKI
jgi:hypothetical protein